MSETIKDSILVSNNNVDPVCPKKQHTMSATSNGEVKVQVGSDSDSINSTDSNKSDAEAKLRSPKRLTNGITMGSYSGSEDEQFLRDQEALRRRSASVLEVKEQAHMRLKDELQNAQKELQLKDEECKKLMSIQDQMGKELEDLTASLFEEANKMVQDANIKRMQSEKLLKEANNKIEVLQAEVSALKALVITSTPSNPNRHLHPQISQKPQKSSPFVKGHRRSTSHHNFMQAVQMSPDLQVPAKVETPPKDSKEIDPLRFAEFKQWKSKPTLDVAAPFLSNIINEDILPCLHFANNELAKSVFDGVMNNTLTVECVQCTRQQCSLTETTTVCHHRIRVKDTERWHLVSQFARNRITTVCSFIAYARYITQGLVKAADQDMYWEIIKHRKQMNMARLGLSD